MWEVPVWEWKKPGDPAQRSGRQNSPLTQPFFSIQIFSPHWEDPFALLSTQIWCISSRRSLKTLQNNVGPTAWAPPWPSQIDTQNEPRHSSNILHWNGTSDTAYELWVKWSENRSGVSDSLRAHGLCSPPCPWNSQGKNTCESESCSVVFDSLRPHWLYSPWNSPGQDSGVGSYSLLQGIFPTQGLNLDLPHYR